MMVNSKKIHLRLFKKSDIVFKVKWINDPEINEYLHYDLPLCPDRTANWFQSIMGNSSREDYVYELFDNNTAIPLGLIGLIGIDKKNKKAEFYIINGEKDFWGKGLASEATNVFLNHVFLKHDLNKVYLYTEVNNIGAQKLFEKIGFKKEGLLKEDLIHMGNKLDRYYYGIYREGFFNGAKC